MLYEYSINTKDNDLFDITNKVWDAVSKSGVTEGACIVYCPHTTAGITINENADPDVISDLLKGLNNAFPIDKTYRHFEGNSCAHIKSSVIGTSQTIIIENERLLLGRWQGIYFCEFDGPRIRKFYVKVIGEKDAVC